ncbi:hypothetical protein BV25DRAFT_1916451 [Artomyces pyxidatus]|uniref:Uncharacterized protein n=1 Tax=Artomyces pyxidatus TaxID=48021 RepID=A0ACB8SZ86_9AGAM|nr:hypothetical protein BV25DRAFT_1916451 [Artomyces pyxidatus]
MSLKLPSNLKEQPATADVTNTHVRTPTTYYTRHRETRCEYQKAYYKVKKIGRRKVSKQAREVAEDKRRRELLGLRAPYSFSLLHSSSTPDPSRTEDMRTAEHDVWDRCFDLMETLKKTEGDDWRARYAETVQEWLDEHLSKAEEVRRTTALTSVDVELHTYRRIIAGLVQELEFIEQGDEVVTSAAEDWGLIWYGRRVNRSTFRQRFGW